VCQIVFGRTFLYLRLQNRMRITLIHNPEAGDANHGRKQLMAALAKAGHHASYQSTKEPGFKKALKQPAIWCLPPAVTERPQKLHSVSSIAAFR
jgi:hypothetical protein